MNKNKNILVVMPHSWWLEAVKIAGQQGYKTSFLYKTFLLDGVKKYQAVKSVKNDN